MQTADRPKFKRFELLSKIGAGLHGRVFLAWDPNLERKVALKILTRQRDTAATMEQFFGEARAVARVSHPNVIPLFEAGAEKGLPYLVFEYVEGSSLKTFLETTTLDRETACTKFHEICVGVAAAHALGIAHLDLSPNNILIDSRGTPRVMDFGLSRFVAAHRGESNSEEDMQGTPRYMSPEHFIGAPLDMRTDVFALGLMFFELLAGRPAANAARIKELTSQLRNPQFDWIALQKKEVPTEIISVIRDALAREPIRRFADAGAMATALQEAMESMKARENRNLAVQFVLRRLQRRPEFPAFSNSIAEINRLTDEDSRAGLQDLADVVMRDFSLANRLMKIANSAFFSPDSNPAGTVASAISRVGTKTVRFICNGLMMFEHLKGDSPGLQDALVESFVSGLLGRLLAQQFSPELAEEAFISAMFNRLGRNLVLYYLADEYTEIQQCFATGMSIIDAERAILASSCAEIGAAVAASWKFPVSLVSTMKSLPPGVLPTPAFALERTRALAHFPNELCALVSGSEALDAPLEKLARLGERFARIFRTNPTDLAATLDVALRKFVDIAPSLGINPKTSGFCQTTGEFLEVFRLMQSMPLGEPEYRVGA